MHKTRILLSVAILLIVANVCLASHQEEQQGSALGGICQRSTLTNGFCGLCDKLSDKGIELAFSTTGIYQQNVRGGISTHRRAGRMTGSYDLELSADMQKFLGVEGGKFYMLTGGSFSDGIDGPSVGSFFGVNADAGGNRSMDVAELWYEQALLDNKLSIRFGKLDLTGGFECRGCPVSFDGSSYANDETTQFFNNALVNNPTIPFPDNGLGAIVHYNPIEWWYVSAGIADARADARETGFATTFSRESHFLSIFETGVTPQLDSKNGLLQGAYRIGLWYDPQPKANSDSGKNYRDDAGFYTSCDQMLVKENADAEDTQGLGAFFRYGYAPGKTNDMTNFWSTGFQYQGLFEGRDNDVLGVGFAHGTFSNNASTTYTEDYESVLEVYYNIEVTPWCHIGPDLQYVSNPGGVKDVSDAVILGVRIQISF